jgi:hypothetical protein
VYDRGVGRLAPVIAVLACAGGACGRVGFSASGSDAAGSDDATALDAMAIDAAPPMIKAIAASGAWSSGASQLRRRLAMSSDPSAFTFATWYKSGNTGTMLLCAGVSASDQTFVWAGNVGGRPFLQHEDATINIGVAPLLGGGAWPYLDTWVHLVIAVDMTQVDPARRVRWWIDGVERPIESQGGTMPQDHPLHVGDAGVVHTIGNKWSGGFDWTGLLAETYLVLGHALDASAFVAITEDGVRSIVYTGPVDAESVYFEYATADAGKNSFAEGDWAATAVGSSSDVPY